LDGFKVVKPITCFTYYNNISWYLLSDHDSWCHYQ